METTYIEQFEQVKNIVEKSNNKWIDHIKAYDSYRPYIRFLTLDALKPQDYPHNIENNSIFITFAIDYIENKVEIERCGHVWISEADRQAYKRDSYLAMHSMREITKRNNGKVMRKTKFKDAKDLAKKILTAWDNIMEQVNDYTGGYPYKEGIKQLKTA